MKPTKPQYAFFDYDVPPYVRGGEINDIGSDGKVTIKTDLEHYYKPIKIVDLEQGMKMQKKIDKSLKKFNKVKKDAYKELKNAINNIMI